MMKITIILIMFILTEASILAQQTAKEFNNLGYEAYKEKQFSKAENYFLSAIKADTTFMLAHYNYACVLSLRWKGNRETLNKIIKHLKITIALNKNRIKNILADKDFDNIRNTRLFINFLLGNRTIDKEYFKPAPGSCAHGYQILFNKNATVKYYEVWEGSPTGDIILEKPRLIGRYAIVGNQIVVFVVYLKTPIDIGYFSVSGIKKSDFIWGTYANGKITMEKLIH